MKRKERRYHVVVLREDGKPVHNRVLEWIQVKRHLMVLGGIVGTLLLGTLAFLILAAWQGSLVKKNLDLSSREHEMRTAFSDLSRVLDETRDRLNRTEHQLSVMEELARQQNLRLPAEPGVGGPSPSARPTPTSTDVGELAEQIHALKGQVDEMCQETQQLSAALEPHLQNLARTPSVWPTKGFIISSFGARQDPFDGMPEHHEGIDIAAPLGSAVSATAEGVVVFAGYKRGYGNTVEISHGNGMLTRYAHLSKILVKPGQTVKRWQRIGSVGSTGRSTGAHLHYEVRKNDRALNPKRYLLF